MPATHDIGPVPVKVVRSTKTSKGSKATQK